MSQFEKINQVNLFAVMMGEKRRKPLMRRALVSDLYPVYAPNDLFLADAAVVDFASIDFVKRIDNEDLVNTEFSVVDFSSRTLIYSLEDSEEIAAEAAVIDFISEEPIKRISSDEMHFIASSVVDFESINYVIRAPNEPDKQFVQVSVIDFEVLDV